MANETMLKARLREGVGTPNGRRLRRSGWVPGAVMKEGGGTVLIQLNEHDFGLLLKHHSSESLVLELDVAGDRRRKVLLKEVQHEPLTGQILHADFQEVSKTTKMRVSIPVVLDGDPVGVTRDGGILEQLVRELEVECLPDALVERIDVDVSALGIGDSVQVGDLDLAESLDVLTAEDVAVACVSAPRREAEPTEEEAEAAEGEPEVIGEAEKREEEED